ncbi:MAG: hypothetical protein IJ176_03340 [Prevotella sp.]|nr:hypothetical protein [Prevotella sp.]
MKKAELLMTLTLMALPMASNAQRTLITESSHEGLIAGKTTYNLAFSKLEESRFADRTGSSQPHYTKQQPLKAQERKTISFTWTSIRILIS